jgi:endothelin-converting enzyme
MNLMASKKSADEQNFDKMKSAYDACLDEDKIKDVDVGPLVEVLDEIKKTYPVDNATSPKDAILLLAKYGVSALITAGTGADDRDPDTVVVSVSAPWSFGLPSKERYEDEKLVEKYRAVAVEVLGNLYPEGNKDTYSEVIDLEKKLAAASPPTEDREDVTKYYNPLAIDKAAELTPQVDLKGLVHDLAPSKVDVARVIVMAPKYQEELAGIINETDPEVLQSYFIWKAVQSFSGYIEADAVKPYKRFTNELVGKVRTSTRLSIDLG